MFDDDSVAANHWLSPARSKMFPHEDHAVAWRFNDCERCGAMVAANNKNRHERWHRAVDSGSLAVAGSDD